MTVKEAIAILQTFDQELELTRYNDYNGSTVDVGEIIVLPADTSERYHLASELHNDNDKMVLIR